jgi:hypothetical protein
MTMLRMLSVWSVLVLMLALDVLVWVEEVVGRASARLHSDRPARFTMR